MEECDEHIYEPLKPLQPGVVPFIKGMAERRFFAFSP
jgi:hypothetical protein